MTLIKIETIMRKKIDKWFDEPQHVAGLTFVHIDTTNERGEYIELSEPKDGMNDILYFDEMSGGQLRELRKFIEKL